MKKALMKELLVKKKYLIFFFQKVLKINCYLSSIYGLIKNMFLSNMEMFFKMIIYFPDKKLGNHFI